MKTDKQFYKLFVAAPQLAYELIGEDPPAGCQCESINLKEIQQDVDLLLTPGDEGPQTILEPQFYNDPTIYARMAVKMGLQQLQNNMREVRGVILFRYAHEDPRTVPWTGIIRSILLRDAVRSLEERNPRHPLIGLFQPLLATNDDTLAEMAPRCYNQIVGGDADQAVKDALAKILVDWLRQRFKDKSKEEIQIMLFGENIDVRETRSGKEIFDIGKAEGKSEGKAEAILKVLKARFTTISPALEQRILEIKDDEQLSNLIIQAAICGEPNELTF